MLTTFDNPFNPFEEFESWFLFDVEKGYNTCAKLDRIAKIEPDMTDNEVLVETERAIDRIIELDFLNIYKKLSQKVTEPTEEDK